MRLFALTISAVGALAFSGFPAESQPLAAAPALTYADLADLALPAPVAAHVRIRNAVALKGAAAAGLPPGTARFYVEADLVSLIRGPRGLPQRVSYLVDVDARAPKLRRKDEFILLAATVPARPAELRLVAPDAQLAFSPARAAQLRAILAEAARADAAPAITGIGRAFHVPGALPGEGETQIFLQAAGGRPVSLNVLRRPGEAPRWAVALSEIVDDAAAPPQPDSLLWYRLACTLPRSLPRQSLAEADPAQADATAADYQLILDRLGPCARTRFRR